MNYTLSIGFGPNFTLVGEILTAGVAGTNFDLSSVANFESGFAAFIATIRNNSSVQLAGTRAAGVLGQSQVAALASCQQQPFTLQLPKNSSQTAIGDSAAFYAQAVSWTFDDVVGSGISWSVSLIVSHSVQLNLGS